MSKEIRNLLESRLDVVSVRLVKDQPLMSEEPITEPEDAVKLIGKELCEMDRECVVILCLKTNGVPICCSVCSIGCLNQALIQPREIFKTAILANAASIILIHNHPSFSLHPSKEDTVITDKMINACQLMDIPLLDHIIVGGNNSEYFSFKEKEIMPYGKLRFETDYHDISFDAMSVAEETPIKHRRHR